jgi:hypothetical protein
MGDLFEGIGPTKLLKQRVLFLDDPPYGIYSLFIGANQAQYGN